MYALSVLIVLLVASAADVNHVVVAETTRASSRATSMPATHTAHDEAIRFVARYQARLAKDPAAAVAGAWDYEAVLTEVFGQEAIQGLSRDEKNEVVSLMLTKGTPDVSRPERVLIYASAKAEAFRARSLSNGSIVVRYNLVIGEPAGRPTTLSHTLVLVRRPDGWRFVNGGSGGGVMLVEGLRSAFLMSDLTPVQLIRRYAAVRADARP